MEQLREVTNDRRRLANDLKPVGREPRGRSFLIGIALLAAMLSGCAPAATKASIEHMLAMAKTASDHDAIAQYYEQEAADDEVKYEEHTADAGRYQHSPKFGVISAQHCYQLAQDYKQASQDASVLAAEHHKVAEEMRSGSEPSTAPIAPGPSAKQTL